MIPLVIINEEVEDEEDVVVNLTINNINIKIHQMHINFTRKFLRGHNSNKCNIRNTHHQTWMEEEIKIDIISFLLNKNE